MRSWRRRLCYRFGAPMRPMVESVSIIDRDSKAYAIPMNALKDHAPNQFSKSNTVVTLDYHGQADFGPELSFSGLSYWKVDCSEPSLGYWSITAPLATKISLLLPGDAVESAIDRRVDLAVVYFFNARVSAPDSPIFLSQLRSLLSCGLVTSQEFKSITVKIVITVTQNQAKAVEGLIRDLLISYQAKHEKLNVKISVKFCFEEAFEYHALHLLWEMAQESGADQTLFVYFHGKGASHKFEPNGRNPREKFLTQIIIENWKLNYLNLILFPGIQKLGFMAGGNGWLWYNFWWARGSFIRMLEPPIMTDRRHYYEDWLGRCSLGASSNYGSASSACLGLISQPKQGIFNINSPVSAELASALCASAARQSLF